MNKGSRCLHIKQLGGFLLLEHAAVLFACSCLAPSPAMSLPEDHCLPKSSLTNLTLACPKLKMPNNLPTSCPANSRPTVQESILQWEMISQVILVGDRHQQVKLRGPHAHLGHTASVGRQGRTPASPEDVWAAVPYCSPHWHPYHPCPATFKTNKEKPKPKILQCR